MKIVICFNKQEELVDVLKALNNESEPVVNEFPIYGEIDTETKIFKYLGQTPTKDYMNASKAIDVILGKTLARFNEGKPKWGIADLRMFTSMMEHMNSDSCSGTYSGVMIAFSELLIKLDDKETLNSLVASLYKFGCKRFNYNNGTDPSNGIDWTNIEFGVIEDLIEVLELGEAKYDRDNWRKSANLKDLSDSLGRHIKYMRNSDRDHESELYHYAHALCNCMFIYYHINND